MKPNYIYIYTYIYLFIYYGIFMATKRLASLMRHVIGLMRTSILTGQDRAGVSCGQNATPRIHRAKRYPSHLPKALNLHKPRIHPPDKFQPRLPGPGGNACKGAT